MGRLNTIGVLIVTFTCMLLSACGVPGNALDSPKTRDESRVGAVAGGAIGAGVAALSANPYTMAALLVPAGAAMGYYFPTTKDETHDIEKVGGAVFQVGDYVTVVLPADAVFDAGSADLSSQAKKPLREVAYIIDDFPESHVIVTSSTDNIGSELHRAELSRKQAQVIALYLWESGIVDRKHFDRIQYAGLGSTRPIADEDTVAGQALNRRLQVTIYPKDMTPKFKQALSSFDIGSVSDIAESK